jgi:WhiB family redox-sensing transcriptional regulator
MAMQWPTATAGVAREAADTILGATLLGGVAASGVPSGLDLSCTDDPELFFAEAPEDVEQAKALCQGCRARIECLAGALERREPWGVWGGELLLRGTIVPRKRPRGRPRKDDPAITGTTVSQAAAGQAATGQVAAGRATAGQAA